MTTDVSRSEQDGGSAVERCVVVSTDSHVGPQVGADLRDYCDAEHLEAFDEFTSRMEAASTLVNEMETEVNGIDEDIHSGWTDGLRTSAARIADMDADGVAANVLYHGGLNGQAIPFFDNSLASWSSSDYDHLEGVGVHIYNRWLADYVADAPKRHVGVAHISVKHLETAAAEARWAKEHGLNAINLPAPRRDLAPYTDPAWDELWATCEELELTICTHAGGGDLDPRFTGPAQNAIFLIELPWMARRGVWHLIFHGVFERHPNLHYVVSEQFGDWIPALLAEMDSAFHWSHGSALRDSLTRLPSEHFRANVFVTASFMSRAEAEMGIVEGFSDKLLWGGDYPHPEGTFPHTLMSLRKTMAGLDRETMDRYLSGNAAQAFRLDLDALRDVADAIGPTYAEIGEPFDESLRPVGSASLGFRDKGHWA